VSLVSLTIYSFIDFHVDMIDGNKLKLMSWDIIQRKVVYVDSNAFETHSASTKFVKRIHTSTRA
jgi:hypothetical protein